MPSLVVFSGTPGQSFPITLNAHNPGAYYSIWIDYNGNKSFEHNEIVFRNTVPAAGTTLQGTITPAYATNGRTRMRIAVSYFAPPGGPCTVIDYGQILDVFTNISSCPSQGLSTSDWVSLVHLNSLDNVTGFDAGYGDYTSLTPPDLTKGAVYTLNFNASTNQSTHLQYFRAWIDFDNDGFFSDAERIASVSANSYGPTLSSVFTVPDDPAYPLGTTKMRVSVKVGDWPGPCEIFAVGEVEDYIVNITNGTVSARTRTPEASSSTENLESETMEVYPNPVSESLHLVMPDFKNGRVMIRDLSGRTVYEAGYSEEVNTSLWSPGVYILTLQNGKQARRFKLVKK
jgi:hypothetical protein